MRISVSKDKKEILLYGVSLAALLIIIQVLEVGFLFYNHRPGLFIGFIALLFTALGIWLASKFSKPGIVTRIVEKEIIPKEVYQSITDQNELTKSGISKRELDVLNLMASGYSNSEIADKLFVSLNTVKTHISNIFIKLDVKRRTQAIEKAKRLKIIP